AEVSAASQVTAHERAFSGVGSGVGSLGRPPVPPALGPPVPVVAPLDGPPPTHPAAIAATPIRTSQDERRHVETVGGRVPPSSCLPVRCMVFPSPVKPHTVAASILWAVLPVRAREHGLVERRRARTQPASAQRGHIVPPTVQLHRTEA